MNRQQRKLERVKRKADAYHDSVEEAERRRVDLYGELAADPGTVSVRALAAVSRLSSARVNQVQHGK